MKRIDRILQSFVKWYCTKRGIAVYFNPTTDCIEPNAKLHINTNGNVGI